MNKNGKLRRINGYLPLLLAFIFVDETCDNYILNVFSGQSSSFELILYASFLLLSIIASPIQAGYSDFYCRKKSLMVSLSASFASLVFSFLSTGNFFSPAVFLGLAIFAKAGLGNTLPLSWAAISDTQERNFRFSLGLSTSAMAFGYLVLILIKNLFQSQSAFVVMLLFLVLIYLCSRFFADIRDKNNINKNEPGGVGIAGTSIKGEIKLIIRNFLKDPRTRKALSAFFFWEVSFYSALIVDVDMRIKGFSNLSLSMLVGYFVGVLILKFSNRKTDQEMIKIGYIVSVLALIPIFALNYFFDVKWLMLSGYFVYSLAAAFLAPSLFSILSRERKPHEQGKIYGLIDSTDTIAFLLASLFVILYNSLNFKPIFLVLFSFSAFLISYVPYAKFKKIAPKTY